jgi:hypothetical protein
MAEQRRTGRAQIDILLNKYVGGVPYNRACARHQPRRGPSGSAARARACRQASGPPVPAARIHEVIYAEGEVVREWIEAENAQADGVRFTLLTERHRQLIRRFVEDAEDAAEATQ